MCPCKKAWMMRATASCLSPSCKRYVVLLHVRAHHAKGMLCFFMFEPITQKVCCASSCLSPSRKRYVREREITVLLPANKSDRICQRSWSYIQKIKTICQSCFYVHAMKCTATVLEVYSSALLGTSQLTELIGVSGLVLSDGDQLAALAKRCLSIF